MDFSIVTRQVIREYLHIYGSDRPDKTWSLDACLNIFRYYYIKYRQTFRRDHPKLSNKTINDIISRFPYFTDSFEGTAELEPEEYPLMIDAYFKQHFDKCDYSIAHFMAGGIRALRFYEELY